MAKKQKAVVSTPEWKPRWPMLEDYRRGRNLFRPRKIQWSPLAAFAVNPYSAGLMCHFSINAGNFTNMLAGGMSDPKQAFQPPAQYRDAFLLAYQMVQKSKRWLVYGVDAKDSGQTSWTEYNLLGENPKRLWDDEAMRRWEDWFVIQRPTMERIHELFSLGGAPEPVMISFSLEDLLIPDNEETEVAAQALGDHERIGLT